MKKALRYLLGGLGIYCSCLSIIPPEANAQTAYAQNDTPGREKALPAQRDKAAKLDLKTALEQIYRKHRLKFIYNEAQLKDIKVSSQLLQLESSRLIARLEQTLAAHHLQLSKTHELQYLIIPASASGQPNVKEKTTRAEIKVNGVVRDGIGNPLPGVTVRVIKAEKGTITDERGRFTIDVDPLGSLEFSFIGYKRQELSVRNRVDLEVVLEAEEGGLNEVVVVGFGKQRKVSLVGAQSGVKVEELKQPVRNLSTLLAGRLAGIVGVQRSGEPGYDDAQIWIRGISTFTNSRPLVLVDGVERPFANVDPQDIESFNILKDASATAVYGVRGANGVILITTKRGKSQKTQINVDLNTGVTAFTRLPEYADGVTYMQMANEAITTRGGTPQYSEETIQKTASGEDPYLYPNVNWIREIFNRFGTNRRANMNIQGGSDAASFYVSASYFDEVGLFKRDELARYNSAIKFTRYNFTTNLNLKVTASTRLEFGVQGYIGNGNYPGTSTAGIFGSALSTPPTVFPVRYPDGKIPALQDGSSVNNPYDQLTQSGFATEFRNQIFSNARVRQDLGFLLKGLSFTTMFSFDTYNQHNLRRTKSVDTWLATGRNSEGELEYRQTRIGTNYLNFSRGNGGNRQFYTETALNYENVFGKHRVGGLLLYNQSDKVDAFQDDFIASIPRRQRGLAGRGTYSFDDRYLFEANFGYNGSETFSPNRRYGFFPSAGLGWIASSEKFMQPAAGVIQFLKFRFSYGLVGNGEIEGRRFAYIATVAGTNGYAYGNERQNNYGDGYDIGEYASDVTWETARKTNLGVELTTLKDRLNIQVDFFHEKRDNIFLRRSSIPAMLGLRSNPYGNLGKTENKGIDASLDFNMKVGALMVGLKGNFTFNKNKVIEDDLPPWAYPYLERKGRKISQRFAYIAEGLFQDSLEILRSPKQTGDVRPGDIKFKDINGDGVINSYDQYPVGYGAVPEIVYGFGLNLAYRNVALGLFFQGVANVDTYTYGEGFIPFEQGGNRGNLMSVITDRWTPENPESACFLSPPVFWCGKRRTTRKAPGGSRIPATCASRTWN